MIDAGHQLSALCGPDCQSTSNGPCAVIRMNTRFLSFQQILDALQALDREAQALLQTPVSVEEIQTLQRLRVWLQGHQRRFAEADTKLQEIPGAGELIGEWLAHAPAGVHLHGDGGQRVATLLARAQELETELLRLIGVLLQHSDGVWVRALYSELLDQATLRADAAHRQPRPL